MSFPADKIVHPSPGMMGKGGTSKNSNYHISIHGNNAVVTHNETSTSANGSVSHTFEVRLVEKGQWAMENNGANYTGALKKFSSKRSTRFLFLIPINVQATMDDGLQYKIIKPGKPLSDFVESFWFLNNQSGSSKETIGLPDGIVDLSLFRSAGEPFRIALLRPYAIRAGYHTCQLFEILHWFQITCRRIYFPGSHFRHRQ